MRMIKPAEISGKIISLIDGADKELVVISPYDHEVCEELSARLIKAEDRGVKISLFVRKSAESFKGLTGVQADIHLVEKLHERVYLNEKQAILTSTNPAASSESLSTDFGLETQNEKEYDEVKLRYLLFVENNGCKRSGANRAYKTPGAHNQKIDNSFSHKLADKNYFFKLHFQKTFFRFNLVYHRRSDSITCANFPFQWTNFEYSRRIKISFLPGSAFNYKSFRNENINEFSELFRNHRTFWNYPYDCIYIFGDEAANGIRVNDKVERLTYLFYLVKEVTRFLQPKEHVLLKTPLFRVAGLCMY